MWETDGEAAREEQGAGASAGECGVPRSLATWLKTGWELENFLPWVERPPLHFEGIRTNSRAQGEARSRKGILIGGDFMEGLMQYKTCRSCLYYLLTVLEDQALNELEPTC